MGRDHDLVGREHAQGVLDRDERLGVADDALRGDAAVAQRVEARGEPALGDARGRSSSGGRPRLWSRAGATRSTSPPAALSSSEATTSSFASVSFPTSRIRRGSWWMRAIGRGTGCSSLSLVSSTERARGT